MTLVESASLDSANPTKNWIGTGSGTSAINGWAKWYHATAANTNASITWQESSAAVNGDRDWVLVANRTAF